MPWKNALLTEELAGGVVYGVAHDRGHNERCQQRQEAQVTQRRHAAGRKQQRVARQERCDDLHSATGLCQMTV